MFGPGTTCRCATCIILPANCSWTGGPFAGILLLYSQVVYFTLLTYNTASQLLLDWWSLCWYPVTLLTGGLLPWINMTQMGKGQSSFLRVEPFAALFVSRYWTCHHLTQPAGLASPHPSGVQAACPFMVESCRYCGGGLVQLSKMLHYFTHLCVFILSAKM